MERLTHERKNGIKTGYWSKASKEELVQRLAAFEELGIDPEAVELPSPNGWNMRERLGRYWETEDPEALENLKNMTPEELFDAWLDYEGVIGYTDLMIQRLRESGYFVEVRR